MLDAAVAHAYQHGRLVSWLDDHLLAAETAIALRTWFLRPGHASFTLEPFLRAERADAVAAALGHLSCWERAHAFANELASYEVSRQEWESATPEQRFFRHDIARPMAALTADPSQRDLVELLTLIASGAVCRWLGTIVGAAFRDVPTLEITRYRHGDFIRRHDDAFTGRALAANLYLDHQWQSDAGGWLEFVGETGRPTLVEPRFNRMALVPVAEGCQHAVLPWVAARPGRFTVSMGISYAGG